ncbi:MAG: acyl-CoA thioesterase [Bacteroidales bacterium]|nr:acyl-CoA thioesterase [Bacteroidales bacterium]
MKLKKLHTGKSLSYETQIKVRFSEVDSMGIVWHGSYVKYLEDGREAFGKKYGISYMDVLKKHGFIIPLVKLDINYKKQLFYEDEIIIKTTLIDNYAAKICFEYEIRRKSDNELILTARTVQIFMNKNRELELNLPDFFKEWKKNNLE